MGRFCSILQLARTMTAAVAVLLIVHGQSVKASCSLTITKAGPCLASGAFGNPRIGEPYGVRVTFNVTGTPSKAFAIQFTLANVTRTYGNISLKTGKGYYFFFTQNLSLDDTIPWSVTLDPDHVSGDTNPARTASGSFSPTPPATAIETYAPVTMQGAESTQIVFQPGSGTVTDLYAILGVPTTHGAQEAVSYTGPSNGQEASTAPYDEEVDSVLDTNVAAGTFSYGSGFTVKLSRMRVNPVLLRKIPWSALNGLTADYTEWLEPDAINECTDPAITAFVQAALPPDYLTSLTPYDAARTLHKAVMRALTYVEPPPYRDAVASLNAGYGDCGCYAAVLTAALRSIGIPARRITGFWQGFSQWHIRVEFYLPGAGWIVADPTEGNAVDPTGTYAYEFGSMIDTAKYVAVDVGDSHVMPLFDLDTEDLQSPNLYYEGDATVASTSFFCFLQPGQTSEYTLLLNAADTSAGIPQGTGYALLTMNSTGGLSMAGELADGESFSTTGTLGGADGTQFAVSAPLSYASVTNAGAQGMLSGTLNFVSTTGTYATPSGIGELGGTLTWVKPQQSGGNYPAAIETNLNVVGSMYLPPASGSGVLPGFTRGKMELSDAGALSNELVKDVSLSGKNTLAVTDPGKDKLKVTITPSTGVFKGTFEYPNAGGKPILTNFIGVLFQDDAAGGGFFLGPGGGGNVSLAP